jgi:hypothetical protein
MLLLVVVLALICIAGADREETERVKERLRPWSRAIAVAVIAFWALAIFGGR